MELMRIQQPSILSAQVITMPKSEGVNMLIPRRGFLKGLGLATCTGLALTPCFASAMPLADGPAKDIKIFSNKRILAVSERYDVIFESFGRVAIMVDSLGLETLLVRPSSNPLALETMPNYVAATQVLNDTLILLDRSHRQLDFFRQGQFLKSIDLSRFTQSPIQLQSDEELLWVVDSASHAAISIDYNGQITTRLGELGLAQGRLNSPVDIAIDNDGFAHILEMGNSRISVWSKQGKWIGSYGENLLTAGSRKLVLNDHVNQTLVIDSWQQALLSLDPMGKHDVVMSFNGLIPQHFSGLSYLSTATGKGLYLAA